MNKTVALVILSVMMIVQSHSYLPPAPANTNQQTANCSFGVWEDEVWADEVGWALYKLRYAKMTHQLFIDKPWRCNIFTGNVEWHEGWVYNYNEIIRILKECSRQKDARWVK